MEVAVNEKLAEFFDCAIKIIESINPIEFAEGKDRPIAIFDVFIHDMFVPTLLNRPKEEVPEDIKNFFVEWQNREKQLANNSEELRGPPEAAEKLDDETIREKVQGMDAFLQEYQQFLNWLASNFPASIPVKFTTLVSENLGSGLDMMKKYIDLAKWTNQDLFPGAEFPKL